MGMGVSRVRSVADRVALRGSAVDPLTGLPGVEHLHAALGVVLAAGARPSGSLVVVVVELPSPTHPVEHARRVTLAGDMARTAFGSALAVGRLGVRRVGVLSGRDADLRTRADLLARMVQDVPARVWVEPLMGDREFGAWLLDHLCH
jgi:hypothetical protein